MDSILFEATLYLAAMVIAVPLSVRLGLGSVLGYLMAGVALGPILQQTGADPHDLQHFAEFGVVMMLFLVGLELEPRLLWEMRARLLGLGGLQVTGTAAAITGIAMAFGQPWQFALAIGLILALVQGGLTRRLAHSWGPEKTAIRGMVLVALGLVGVAWTSEDWHLWASLLPLSAGSAMAMPMLSTIVSSNVSAEEQGAALGVFRSLGSLSRAIGPFAAHK